MNNAQLQNTAQNVANSTLDQAQDYGMDAHDMLHDIVKQWGCDLGWDNATRSAVYAAASKML